MIPTKSLPSSCFNILASETIGKSVRRSVVYSPLRGNEDIYSLSTVLFDSRKLHLFPSMRVSAVQRFLLNDVGVKDRQLARCGGRLDVRGLVCLLPDNTGCHIKMVTRSDMALLECHSQPFNKSSPPSPPACFLQRYLPLFISLRFSFPYIPLTSQITFYISDTVEFCTYD